MVEKTPVEEPTQRGAGDVIAVMTGSAEGVTVNVYAVPAPQVSFAETEITATPVPVVKLIELVVLEPVQPVPVTDQL